MSADCSPDCFWREAGERWETSCGAKGARMPAVSRTGGATYCPHCGRTIFETVETPSYVKIADIRDHEYDGS